MLQFFGNFSIKFSKISKKCFNFGRDFGKSLLKSTIRQVGISEHPYQNRYGRKVKKSQVEKKIRFFFLQIFPLFREHMMYHSEVLVLKIWIVSIQVQV